MLVPILRNRCLSSLKIHRSKLYTYSKPQLATFVLKHLYRKHTTRHYNALKDYIARNFDQIDEEVNSLKPHFINPGHVYRCNKCIRAYNCFITCISNETHIAYSNVNLIEANLIHIEKEYLNHPGILYSGDSISDYENVDYKDKDVEDSNSVKSSDKDDVEYKSKDVEDSNSVKISNQEHIDYDNDISDSSDDSYINSINLIQENDEYDNEDTDDDDDKPLSSIKILQNIIIRKPFDEDVSMVSGPSGISSRFQSQDQDDLVCPEFNEEKSIHPSEDFPENINLGFPADEDVSSNIQEQINPGCSVVSIEEKTFDNFQAQILHSMEERSLLNPTTSQPSKKRKRATRLEMILRFNKNLPFKESGSKRTTFNS